jgi:hypothetical protein
MCLGFIGLVEVSASGGSSKLDRVLLVSGGSITRPPTSCRVFLAHMGLYSSSRSITVYLCTNFSYECIDSILESDGSSESELSFEEESACQYSSSLKCGRTKVSACDC